MHAILRTTSINGQPLEVDRLIHIAADVQEAQKMIDDFTDAYTAPLSQGLLVGICVTFRGQHLTLSTD